MKILQPILLSMMLAITFLACGQNSSVFKALPNSYQIDHDKKIIVLNIDASEFNDNQFDSVILDDEYLFSTQVNELQNTHRYSVTKGKDMYTLFVTKSPIIAIHVKDSLTKHPKVLGHFRYFDADTTFTSAIGMDLRGNLSLTYPKKSFNVEFYTDSISREKKDVKFKKMYKDDDWILDGLYNEPLLLRAYTSQKLWKDIHTPWYASKEPKASATADGTHVDLFVNNEYRGVYLLSEKINRKLLKLKKKKGDTVRGELFKAGYYRDGTSFKAAPDFKNSLPTWSGWEMEYPYEDYTAHYDNLHEAITFLVNSDTALLEEKLDAYFSETNLIDYFLFANLIRATDNLGKNYYLARYHNELPNYFIVPWDMDGVMGTIQAGKRIPTTDDILTNALFDKMLASTKLKNKMNTRWTVLRTHQFATDSLVHRIEKQYQKLERTRMYERDELAWGKTHEAEHLEYMLDWLQKRVAYLDTYFSEEK